MHLMSQLHCPTVEQAQREQTCYGPSIAFFPEQTAYWSRVYQRCGFHASWEVLMGQWARNSLAMSGMMMEDY